MGASHTSESEKSNNSDKVDLGRRMNETADLSEYTNDPSSLYIDVDLPPSRPSSAPKNTLAASLLCHPKGGAGFIRVRSGPSVGRGVRKVILFLSTKSTESNGLG